MISIYFALLIFVWINQIYYPIISQYKGEIMSGDMCLQMSSKLPPGRKLCPVLLYSDATQVYRWKSIDVSDTVTIFFHVHIY